MEFLPTDLPDVVLIQPRVFVDHRGSFMETFQARLFKQAGLPTKFVQDNQSISHKGTLRGLHYQIKHPQGKLIRVVVGEIYDVAVDIRRNSPTFGQSVTLMISAENKCQVWVPSGFAHGFLVTSNLAVVIYKTTDFYYPKYERTLLWNDPALSINWPLRGQRQPVVVEKDRSGSLLSQAELFDEGIK